jgi:hypothetical protein
MSEILCEYADCYNYYEKRTELIKAVHLPLFLEVLASPLFRVGMRKHILALTSEFLTIEPMNVELWKIQGEAAAAGEDLELAEASYHKVLEINPKDQIALRGLCGLMDGKKDYASGLDFAARLAPVPPHSIEQNWVDHLM